MRVMGVDIGGSGIKGAPVDTEIGELIGKRIRIPTPQPSKPKDVARVVGELVRQWKWTGPIGCTFPAVVQHGVVHTAANVDQSWIGANGQRLFEEETGQPVVLLNDADAAGIAEMTFGAGRDQQGVVLMLTFGTGVGSALFSDGVLVPNTELGHIEVRGKDGEDRASDRAREERGWDWEQWTKRVNEYLERLELLLWPDLIIFGGGVSKEWAEFGHLLKTKARIVPAELRNEAGIVGAALAAGHAHHRRFLE